ncbi:MAG: F0F1 ATP synthase subunit A, partial [Candidatus Binataceae bacterium]
LEDGSSLISALAGDAISPVLLGTWIVMAILVAFGFMARRSLAGAADATIPEDRVSLRSVSEALVSWLDGFVHGVLEDDSYRDLVPFFGTIFMFVLFANFFGLIPGMEPPTGDSDLTFGLGVVAFTFYIVQGFRTKGLAYFRSFLGPLLPLAPLMLPIDLADNLIRPFSLGVRLYANMFADHTVLSIFTGLTYLIVPLAFYALGSIFCIIQAMIFMVLSISYVRLAAGHDH